MKAYSTEVSLSTEQQIQYARTVGTCRYIYNLFISANQERHQSGLKYIDNYKFSLWLNNEYLRDNPDKIWIKDVSSKSVRNAIDNAHGAFKNFFKKQSGFPKFKKKSRDKTGMYFVRTSMSQPIKCERHRIKVPTLGWVRLKEYGYVPKKDILSGHIKCIAGRYYISVIVDQEAKTSYNNSEDGIGVDLGVKDFAVLSDGTKYHTKKHKKLLKKLNREQRRLSRKLKNKKGDATRNIEKQVLKVAKIHHKISNARKDYIHKITSDIVKRKPSFITVEDLNVKGMMKNRHLSKAISNQGFNMFVEILKYKAHANSIEIRMVGRFYPSSKLCSVCGTIKPDLKLSDRTYKCDCGNELDRDVNAAINLKAALSYTII
jgi:putative transposase